MHNYPNNSCFAIFIQQLDVKQYDYEFIVRLKMGIEFSLLLNKD